MRTWWNDGWCQRKWRPYTLARRSLCFLTAAAAAVRLLDLLLAAAGEAALALNEDFTLALAAVFALDLDPVFARDQLAERNLSLIVGRQGGLEIIPGQL